jgi:curli biogenesis system outer membrane secretion channel CsgG
MSLSFRYRDFVPAAGSLRVLAVALLLAALAPPPAVRAAAPHPSPAPTQATKPAPSPFTGPKQRIAVAKFGAIGSFSSAYSGWDIGGGLAAQLTTALVESGRYIVVERAELAAVLREQETGAQRLVSAQTAAQIGEVLGAQLLVVGSVTEFDQKQGGSVSVSVFGGSLGKKATVGSVGIDVRVIDTTTGQVIQSKHAEGKVVEKDVSAGINVKAVSFGGDQFNSTPLGQASRQAIEQAVALITQATEHVRWSAKVADVAGDVLYLNVGVDDGIRVGDVFVVTRAVRQLTDPSTGLALGAVEQPLGEVQVVEVKEKFSVAKIGFPSDPQRGDIARLPERAEQRNP